MNRRFFLHGVGALTVTTSFSMLAGCRSTQKARVMKETEADMVGSHTAGAETWEPLIEGSVGKLLGRQAHQVLTTAGSDSPVGRKKICFLGVENKSAEELGDFREQIYEKIDQCIASSETFDVINRKFLEAGLRQSGIRPEDLFVPAQQRQFMTVMEQDGQPVDALLYATVTSGTTRNNDKSYQRDYLLTLELIDLHSGRSDKESAEIRKGYSKRRSM